MLALNQVAVTYPSGIKALKPTTFTIEQGQFVVLLGRSGAGKSTLLRTLNGLVVPTEGRITAEGLGPLSDPATLRRHRRTTGMIFQQHQLIGRLPALANVMTGRLGYHSALRSLLPLPGIDQMIALRCLERVGLLDKALARVDQLSGGQQQRVGIARALAQQPRLMLADEPVASLDPATAASILTQLREISANDGITVVVSLHQLDLARRFADRVIGMRAGQVVADVAARDLTDAAADAVYREDAMNAAPVTQRMQKVA
ncbi:MAG: phosphonate ABC transporter ATP-binding protein [Aurantimonas endophytica]|uniref:phosphonate ABC transporter ATP-binding protein n=1 Tax=Aurantimonas endophytica TaxID=1522175 RepID=UPI00300389C9